MSRICAMCGKGSARANHVSHSNIKIPRKQKANLQLTKVREATMKLCGACRRTVTKKMT